MLIIWENVVTTYEKPIDKNIILKNSNLVVDGF